MERHCQLLGRFYSLMINAGGQLNEEKKNAGGQLNEDLEIIQSHDITSRILHQKTTPLAVIEGTEKSPPCSLKAKQVEGISNFKRNEKKKENAAGQTHDVLEIKQPPDIPSRDSLQKVGPFNFESIQRNQKASVDPLVVIEEAKKSSPAVRSPFRKSTPLSHSQPSTNSLDISSEELEELEREETHLNKHLDDSFGEDLHKLFQSDQSREGMECTQDHH
ncbi:unnamed protein product, partial [Citrullus colocynthis]